MALASRAAATRYASARAAALLVAWLPLACQVPGALRERLFSSYAEVDPLDPEARLSELNVSDALVSGGFGLRYRLTEKNPLHYRIDVAWGEDDFELYFSIGEAF